MPRTAVLVLAALLLIASTPCSAWGQVTGVRRTALKSRQTWADVVARDRILPTRPPRPVELGPRTASPNRGLIPDQPTASMLPWMRSPLDAGPWTPYSGPAPDACAPFMGNMLVPTRDFEALDDNLTSIPPDTMGAVGLRHAMTTLNTEVRIQDRAGIVEYSRVGIAAFWPTLSAPFDPKTYHDNNGLRWITVALGGQKSAGSNLAIQVSDTADPTGGWTTITLDGDAANSRWVDFPCVGFNSRWIVVTGTMFGVPGVPNPGPLGTKMWVLDKSEFYGPGGNVTVWEFDVGFAPIASVMQPAVVHDALENDILIIENTQQTGQQTGRNLFRLSRLSGAVDPVWTPLPGSAYTSNPGYFEGPHRFTNGLYNGPQMNSAFSVEMGDSRACNAVVRNGRLWFTHSGKLIVGGFERPQTALYWYELTPELPNPIVQAGYIGFGDNYHLSHPSIAVNCNNDVCIGYSYTSPNDFVSAHHSTRRSSDPPNVLFTNPTPMGAGQTTYVRLGDLRNRWGDYSATVVDPLDNMSFWTIQERASSTMNQWVTDWYQLAHDCQGTPIITQQPLAPAALCPGSSFSLSVQATGGGGSYTYQWIKDGEPIPGAYFQTYTKQNATPDDTGVYSVNVYGPCAVNQSVSVQVNVGVEIVVQPAHRNLSPCSAAFFTVEARGNGPLTYQWFRMGPLGVPIPLSDTDRRTGTRSATMVITGVRYEDEADYLCQVSDSCPTYSPFSDVAQLRIVPAAPAWERRAFSGPTVRHAQSVDMVYDATRGVCVMYGGSGPVLQTGFETWEWDGVEWTRRFPPNSPGYRAHAELVYDSTRGKVLLFGGTGSNGEYNADVWEYDGADWTLLAPTPAVGGPPGQYWKQGDATYDPVRRRLVILTEGPAVPGQPTNTTWEFDPATLAWTQTHSGVGPYQPWSQLAYDESRSELISPVHGSLVTAWLATWRYNSPTWNIIPGQSGLDRYYPSIAYDSFRQRITSYACCRGSGPGNYHTDTWAFNGTFWTPILPSFHVHPFQYDAVIPASMAFDSRRRAMVMIGSDSLSTGVYPLQTWEYRYLDAIMIDRQPVDQPLNIGQSATFRVFAAGGGSLTYQWRRNGLPLTDGTTPHASQIAGATTSTLLISGLAQQDAGAYDCVITSQCGQATTTFAQLGTVCIPDLTGSAAPASPGFGVPNGIVNSEDFFYYLSQFVVNNLGVCDITTTAVPGSPGYGVPDGVLNSEDFFYYLAVYAAGC